MRPVALSLFVLIGLLLGATPMSYADENAPVAIVIHGGAGTIQRDKMSPEMQGLYQAKLTEAVQAGHEILITGGHSRDAVIAAINVMEDSPLFNAGLGAVFNHAGDIELDASIMEGRLLNAGAVAGVGRIKNPINLANAVLEHSPHVMLIGAGAEEFAASQGLAFVSNDYFKTERRRHQLEKIQREEGGVALSEAAFDSKPDPYAFDEKKLGTVGAVAIDQWGDIAAGTSTGGMTNKRFGRVGDAPIIGAGTYADNQACGISATGHGEYFIRAAVAHDICARVAYKGISLQQAADEVVLDKLVKMQAEGGIIGIDPQANTVFSFNSLGMYRAAIDKTGKLTVLMFGTD
ncbi:MAG: isoaspartyl peptidase/L-asparaginase [SAR86 cluster bacterium]